MVIWVSCAEGLKEWGGGSASIVERLWVVVRALRGSFFCLGLEAALRACTFNVWRQV